MIKFFTITSLIAISFIQGNAASSNLNNFKNPVEEPNMPDNKGRESEIAGTKAPWVKNSGQWE